VLFHQDASRVRERTLANNTAWLRRVALSLLKHHPCKDSNKQKQQTAAWNHHFLAQELLFQSPNFPPPEMETLTRQYKRYTPVCVFAQS